MKRFDEKTKRYMGLILFAMVLLLLVLKFNSVLHIIGFLISASVPVIAGLSLAFVLNVPMSFLEHKVFAFFDKSKSKTIRGLKRPLCLVLALVFVAMIIAFVGSLIVPTVMESVRNLIAAISKHAGSVPSWLSNAAEKLKIPPDVISKYTISREKFMETIVEFARNKSAEFVEKTATITLSLISTITNVGLAIVVAIYTLACKDKARKMGGRILDAFTSPTFAGRTRKVLNVAYKSFAGFISGQFLDSVILGMLCYIGMTVFRFPYPAVISVIVGVLQLIPVIGGIISAIISTLLILMVSPVKAIMFFIFLIAVQQLEGNLVYPKIVGEKVGLPGIVVISIVIIGANTFGILGVVVGIPLVSTAYALLKIVLDNKEKMKEKEKEPQAQ